MLRIGFAQVSRGGGLRNMAGVRRFDEVSLDEPRACAIRASVPMFPRIVDQTNGMSHRCRSFRFRSAVEIGASPTPLPPTLSLTIDVCLKAGLLLGWTRAGHISRSSSCAGLAELNVRRSFWHCFPGLNSVAQYFDENLKVWLHHHKYPEPFCWSRAEHRVLQRPMVFRL